MPHPEGSPAPPHAVTPPTVGSSSSSLSSSSLDDRREFRELNRAVDESRQRYSDTTHEVGQLERCLSIVKVALITSKRETTTAQAATTNAQARIVGEGSLCLVILSDIHNF